MSCNNDNDNNIPLSQKPGERPMKCYCGIITAADKTSTIRNYTLLHHLL